MAEYVSRPNAPGDSTQLEPVPKEENYERMADSLDSTGTIAFESGVFDLYNFEDLPSDFMDVSSVIVFIRAKSDSNGIVRVVLKEGGVTSYTGYFVATESPFVFSYSVDAPSGGAWTVAKFNSIQAGPDIPNQILTGSISPIEIWFVVNGPDFGSEFGTATKANPDVISASVQIPPMKNEQAAVAQIITQDAEVPV